METSNTRINKRWKALAVFVAGLTVVVFATAPGRALLRDVLLKARGRSTISDRVTQYGAAAEARMKPRFDAAGVDYPPEHVLLVGFKRAARLDLYAGRDSDQLLHIWSYPILGASGIEGPKLREGDKQVPEGLYSIESLNPNSRFHLSLRINYPNEHDRARAAVDGRVDLGSDIMIHGKSASIGCLAMGDEAAEDLFVLAAAVELDHVEVLLCPYDFRKAEAGVSIQQPEWVMKLYDNLAERLPKLPELGG